MHLYMGVIEETGEKPWTLCAMLISADGDEDLEEANLSHRIVHPDGVTRKLERVTCPFCVGRFHRMHGNPKVDKAHVIKADTLYRVVLRISRGFRRMLWNKSTK